MKDLVLLAEEYLSSGKEVVISAKGNSMKPLLRDNKDRIVLTGYKPEELEIGQVVLYKRNDGSFVIHRIVDKQEDKYVMLGDFQTVIEKGVTKEQIIAVASGFIRGKNEFRESSKFYKFYVKIWGKKAVVRKAYIFCCIKFSSIRRKLGL